MAFSASIIGVENIGSKTMVYGTFTNADGSTGGDISTGLNRTDGMILQHTGASVVASAPVINETFPVVSFGAVTIVTVANESGIFLAWGE